MQDRAQRATCFFLQVSSALRRVLAVWMRVGGGFGSRKKDRTHSCAHSTSIVGIPIANILRRYRGDSPSISSDQSPGIALRDQGPPGLLILVRWCKVWLTPRYPTLGFQEPRYSNPFSSFSCVGNCLGCEVGVSSVSPRSTGYQPKAVCPFHRWRFTCFPAVSRCLTNVHR